MTAEELRKVSGGVVGQFTPKEVEVDYTQLAGSAGAKSIGLKVPAGKLIIGGYIKNKADDYAGSGATLRLSIASYAGDEKFGAAAATVDAVKGKGVYQPVLADPDNASTPDTTSAAIFTTAEADVQLTTGAAPTAGKLIVGVLYI